MGVLKIEVKPYEAVSLICTDRHGPWRGRDNEKIQQLIGLSRAVLRRNGNSTYDAPIDVITDDLTLAHTYLRPQDKRPAADGFVGFCWEWPQHRVIWIRNEQDRPRRAVISTICHEVTHALTSGVHG